jgi:uncharacterized protein YkvS
MIQIKKATVGVIKNFKDGSKEITFTIDRKRQTQELHELDDLWNNEVIICIFTMDEARDMAINQGLVSNLEIIDEETNYTKLTQTIFLLIKNTGLELRKKEIYLKLINKESLREATSTELNIIYDFLIKDCELPVKNYSFMRDRLITLLDEKKLLK